MSNRFDISEEKEQAETLVVKWTLFVSKIKLKTGCFVV